MRICPVSSVQPFVAMPAPVYVFLRANEKFVAVKSPLDFFTPAELAKFSAYESFFMPEFVDQLRGFREAGRRIKMILSWKPEGDNAADKELPPHEVSDAVIRIAGRLWCPLGDSEGGREAGIESFFVSVMVSELCEALSEESLNRARDRDVIEYERAMLASSWIVFLALHLGYCDLAFLNRLRQAAFDGAVSFSDELAELQEIVRGELEATSHQALRSGAFSRREERVARKIFSRLVRIERQLMDPAAQAPTIFGEKGWAA